MPTTSPLPDPAIVLPPNASTPPPSVLCSASLPPQEIERICKAFIRLISAKEKATYDRKKPAK